MHRKVNNSVYHLKHYITGDYITLHYITLHVRLITHQSMKLGVVFLISSPHKHDNARTPFHTLYVGQRK